MTTSFSKGWQEDDRLLNGNATAIVLSVVEQDNGRFLEVEAQEGDTKTRCIAKQTLFETYGWRKE